MEARWGEIIHLWQRLGKTHGDLRAAIISQEAMNLLKCLWAKSLTSTFQPDKVNKARWGLMDSNIICCINIHVMTWKDNQNPLTTGKKQALTSLSNVYEVNQLTVRCWQVSDARVLFCVNTQEEEQSFNRWPLRAHVYHTPSPRLPARPRAAAQFNTRGCPRTGQDRTRLPPCSHSSSFEEGLLSSLWLFNKAETCSFGVRPASLIALIIDLWLFSLPALCNSETEPVSVVRGAATMRYEEKGLYYGYVHKPSERHIVTFWKIVSFDLSKQRGRVKFNRN